MKTHQIAFLMGDGVGPILCRECEETLRLLADRCGFQPEFKELPFGKGAFEQSGDCLPPETVTAVESADGALLFGVDSSGIPGATPVGRLRRDLKLYAELREVQAYPNRWTVDPGIRVSFVREITEGFLCDRNLYRGAGEWMTDENTAMSMRVITYEASHRIARYAFDYARKNAYKRVTAAHKATIFKMTCGMFLRACRDVAALYPEIDYEESAVDDVAGRLVSEPGHYGVIVTTNLFGDILSDVGSALVSGQCVGVNIGAQGKVYMPVSHSAAFRQLEEDVFDAVPALLSAVRLLKDVGEMEGQALLQQAVIQTDMETHLCGKAFFRELNRRIAI